MKTILLQSLVASLIINIAMFLVAFKNKTDKLTDISYALTFFLLAGYGLYRGSSDIVAQLIFVAITVWASRLGGFLLYRVWQKGKDSRFDKMRGSFLKFGRFWVLQAVTVWVVMVGPMLLLASSKPDRQLGLVAAVGILIFLKGLIIETIADVQKYQFSLDKKNKNKWIAQGIWKYSRHPNYFGEMLVWSGLFIVSTAYLERNELVVSAVSPVFIIVLLMFVSGIPILEKYADKKWGDDSEYQAYKKRTSLLLLLPNKK